jgi:hypothetical protein
LFLLNLSQVDSIGAREWKIDIFHDQGKTLLGLGGELPIFIRDNRGEMGNNLTRRVKNLSFEECDGDDITLMP